MSSKCYGFTVCKKYLSYSVVLSLLPILCNHSNLTLKFHQKVAIFIKDGFL